MFFEKNYGIAGFRGILVATSLCAFAMTLVPSMAKAQDESKFGSGISRFFRLGASRGEPRATPSPRSESIEPEEIARIPADRSYRTGTDIPADPAAPFQPAVTSPGFGESSSTRLVARPKHAGPVTEADPLLTRVGIARADSGNSFALFLQVYADGTVIDSEGVHRLPIGQIKAIHSVIRGHDFSKIRGHCGQPSADFIENVQMVVYDRSIGRLRAHAFSYAGNPAGCDPAVAHLHKAVEELIMKIASSRSGDSSGGSISVGGLPSAIGDSAEIHESTPVLPSRVVVTEVPSVIDSQGQAETTIPAFAAQAAPSPSVPAGTVNGAIVPRLPSSSTPSPFVPRSSGSAPELLPPQ